jgi:hypothetical protein
MSQEMEFETVPQSSGSKSYAKIEEKKDFNLVVLTKPRSFPSTLADVKERHVIGIWHFEDKCVKILDLKKTILQSLLPYSKQKVDWNKFKFSITRVGSGKLDTKYTISGFPFEGLEDYVARQAEVTALILKEEQSILSKGAIVK